MSKTLLALGHKGDTWIFLPKWVKKKLAGYKTEKKSLGISKFTNPSTGALYCSPALHSARASSRLCCTSALCLNRRHFCLLRFSLGFSMLLWNIWILRIKNTLNSHCQNPVAAKLLSMFVLFLSLMRWQMGGIGSLNLWNVLVYFHIISPSDSQRSSITD